MRKSVCTDVIVLGPLRMSRLSKCLLVWTDEPRERVYTASARVYTTHLLCYNTRNGFVSPRAAQARPRLRPGSWLRRGTRARQRPPPNVSPFCPHGDPAQPGLVLRHHADRTLSSFCQWQSGLTGKDGTRHDHAILLTGLDICSWKNEPCDTLGEAPRPGSGKRACALRAPQPSHRCAGFGLTQASACIHQKRLFHRETAIAGASVPASPNLTVAFISPCTCEKGSVPSRVSRYVAEMARYGCWQGYAPFPPFFVNVSVVAILSRL